MQQPLMSQTQRSKKFFEQNTIKVAVPQLQLHSYSSQQLLPVSHTQSKNSNNNSSRSHSQAPFEQQSKLRFTRAHSFGRSGASQMSKTHALRLNPKEFMHREVFNTRLYQTAISTNNGTQQKSMNKFFKIEISRKQRQQSQLQLGDQIGQFFINISKTLQTNNYHDNQQLKKLFKSVMHFLYQLQKYTCMIPKKQPMKIALVSTIQSLEAYLSEVTSQIEKLRRYQKQQQLNITNLKRKKQMIQQHQLLSLQKQIKSRLQPQKSTQLETHKAKISHQDFQLKKQSLKIQQLQQQLTKCRQQISRLSAENLQMRQQRENIQKWKDDYEYKIRKLREELEVAHIVKEQNLEDKYDYILGWKL